MRIGDVAKATNLSVRAIRLYEQQGLLPVVPRKNKYREYSDHHIEALEYIICCKQLGFSLEDIKRSIVYSNKGEFDWSRALKIVQRKINSLVEEINEKKLLLKEMKKVEKNLTKLT